MNGHPDAERSRAGWTDDRGDIDGIPNVCVEIKDEKRINLAGYMKELEVEVKNRKSKYGVCIIISVLTILAFAFGAYIHFDHRYTLAQEFKSYKQQSDFELMKLKLQNVMERIWKIDEKFENKKMDSTAKETLNRLEMEKEELNNKIKALEK